MDAPLSSFITLPLALPQTRLARHSSTLAQLFAVAILMLFFGLAGPVYALDSAPAAFEKGNALFKEGKFTEAEQAYELALTHGDNASVRFNIARARESLGDSAGAMLEWERALRIDPGHRDSLKALEEARRATGAITPPRYWWNTLRSPKTVGMELWFLAGGLWLCAGAWGLATLSRRAKLASSVAVCGLCLAALGGAWKYDAAMEADAALVRERSVTVRGAPADPARSLGELPVGSRLRILGESAGWFQCAIPGIGTGWLPSKAVERIANGVPLGN